MRVTIVKPGKSDCLHEYVYSDMVLLTYPPIETRICKYCGQVEDLQEDPSRGPTFGELMQKFHGKKDIQP